MFFRRGFFNPTTAFANGAKSVNYFGIEMSRRHCATSRSSMIRGFVDPKKFLSSTTGAGGATCIISALASQVAATRSISMSAVQDHDLALLQSVVEQALASPFSLLSCYVPSGCSCGTVPLTRLMICEEFHCSSKNIITLLLSSK